MSRKVANKARASVALCGQSDTLQNQVHEFLCSREHGEEVKFVNVVKACDQIQKMTRGRTELGEITPHNIKQLKRLNQVLFPVTYNDKFYKDVLEVGELAKLAYFNDIVVGAVCCRKDASDNQKRLYIMTLGCLANYRRLRIGTVMLEHVLKICDNDGTFDNVFLHVQVNNEGAIKFYEKFGFEIVEKKTNYYKRIEPADAYVLQKSFHSSKPPASMNGCVEIKDVPED